MGIWSTGGMECGCMQYVELNMSVWSMGNDNYMYMGIWSVGDMYRI